MESQTNTDQVENTPTAAPQTKPGKKLPRQRHFLAVFFFSFMWGTWAVDRFYLGKVWTGLLKLITFGGFGLWTLIDFVIIMTGHMKDKQGREMLQVAEYKKFAGKTVLIFAIVLGLVILANGLLLIYGVTQVIIMVQDGAWQSLVPNLNGILQGAGLPPDALDQLKNLNPQDLQSFTSE